MLKIKEPLRLALADREYLAAMTGIYPEYVRDREILLKEEYETAFRRTIPT